MANAFVLTATQHGTMIANRLDRSPAARGVGNHIVDEGSCDLDQIQELFEIIQGKHSLTPGHVVVVDIGANIGTHAIYWGARMRGWGSVIAFEPQEPIFYCLAGNIVLNNCLNVRAVHAAVSDRSGSIGVPRMDYSEPVLISGLNLMPLPETDTLDAFGQPLSFAPEHCEMVRLTTVDEEFADLARLDLLKIDTEGMDLRVLNGARETIRRLRPFICVETIVRRDEVTAWLDREGYFYLHSGQNTLAFHRDDPITAKIQPASSEAA